MDKTLAVTPSVSISGLTPDQKALLKRTIAVDHTDDELELFASFCKSRGLDPFAREVYSIKRKGKVTFQIGIDGLRGKAEETGEYDGSEVFWCGPDGKWVDVWTRAEPPFAAKVLVWRMGREKPFVAIALWKEYKPADNDFMWVKMPANQLAKTAEALALRKAFPRKLGGLYAKEEMEQADHPGSSKPPVAMPRPRPDAQSALAGGELRPDADRQDRGIIVDGGAALVRDDAPDIPFGDGEAPPEAHVKPITDAQRKRLWARCKEKGVSEEKLRKAVATLYDLTTTKLLTTDQADELLGMIEKGALR